MALSSVQESRWVPFLVVFDVSVRAWVSREKFWRGTPLCEEAVEKLRVFVESRFKSRERGVAGDDESRIDELEVVDCGVERITLSLRSQEFHALASVGSEIVLIEVVCQFLHGGVHQREFAAFGTAVEIVDHDFLRDDVAIVAAELGDFLLDVGFPSNTADVHRNFSDLVVVGRGARESCVFVAVVVLVDEEDSDVVLSSLVVCGKVAHELDGPVGDAVTVVGRRRNDVQVEDRRLDNWRGRSAGAGAEDLGVGHRDLADERTRIVDADGARVAGARVRSGVAVRAGAPRLPGGC